MSVSVFDLIIGDITEALEKERISVASVLPNCQAGDLDELEKWWKDAEKAFKCNKHQLHLVSILYQASKASLLLKNRPFTPKYYEAASVAIHFLSTCYPKLMQNMMVYLYNSKVVGIKNSRSLNSLLEWLKIVDYTETAGNRENLRLLIIECLDPFCYEIPKQTLLFFAQSGIASKINVDSLILKSLELSLTQIENESQLCSSESFGKFKESVKVLWCWIDMIHPNIYIGNKIAEAKSFLSQLLKSLENSIWETHAKISEAHPSKKIIKNNADQDIVLDKTRISQEYCILKYSGDGLDVYIYQGYLDESIKICIKYFVISSQQRYEVFNKEKEQTKFLSEKHSRFLKYYGWLRDVWKTENHEFEVLAIVTESFKTTLIEDIMLHSKNQVKYTQSWFFENVKNLLDAFYYLEKSNIPHFDIRPHNMYVTNNNKLKIGGFYFSGMTLTNVTDDSVEKGEEIWKDWYYAPELSDTHGFDRNETLNEIKAGVFSLGLVFLQMYSLYEIRELNTPEFWAEIDDYVSSFKPLIVADLLRNMLKLNKSERPSFFECLELVQQKEKSVEEYKEIKPNIQFNFQNLEFYLKSFKKIESSNLKPSKMKG